MFRCQLTVQIKLTPRSDVQSLSQNPTMSITTHLPTVLLIRHNPTKLQTKLATRGFNIIPSCPSADIPLFLSTHSTSTRAIIVSTSVRVDSLFLSLLPHLRFIATTSSGVDHIDLLECKNKGINVANVPDVYSVDVADCAVGLLIDASRNISSGDRFVRNGSWKNDYRLGFRVGGKRIGIVGLGKIGSRIAERLEAFKCEVAYTSRTMKSSVHYQYFPNLQDLATWSDVLVLCCSLNEETHHMVDGDVMDALGREGVIVNVGRGALVDEKEMVRRLVEGGLRGAGLDVFEKEPDVPEELVGLDNVVLMPHRATFTGESLDGLAELLAGNLKAFFANEPLVTPVFE